MSYYREISHEYISKIRDFDPIKKSKGEKTKKIRIDLKEAPNSFQMMRNSFFNIHRVFF